MKTYLRKGEFLEGRMVLKIRAAVMFAENTRNSVIICSLTNMGEDLAGSTGTVIYK